MAGGHWDKADDAKLLHIFKGDPSLSKKLETPDVQDFFRRHFPGKKFVNFSPLFKRKARQFALTQTLQRVRSDKKKANQKKRDREDNSDEELSDEEEEDEEDSDEEDSDEQDTKMPAKTPKTPLKAKAPAAAAAESVTSAMASMTVSGFKPYSMSFQSPYMVKSFMHNDRKGVTVEFLVLTVSEEAVRLSVDSGGLVLSLGLVMPEFFPEEERVLVSNMGIAGFDNNTNQYTAHQAVVQDIRREYAAKVEIVGAPQKVKLPFQCELDILGQELHLFNGDEDISAGLGGIQQYYSVLKVDLLAVERTTTKKTKPAMRVVGSASLADQRKTSLICVDAQLLK